MAIGRPKSTPESFWRRVDKRDPWECWPWKGGTRNGYGHHCIDRKGVYAHRYAYELAHGAPPPSGKSHHVMHSCNNKLCCNPHHLSLGTAADNTRAAYRDGLARSGEQHPRTKYPAELIDMIRNDPRPQMELQRVYGIRQGYISNIKLGKSRKHG